MRLAVGKYEKEYKPEVMTKHPKLSDLGRVRVAARLVDENYYRRILERSDPTIEETVDHEREILQPFRKLLNQPITLHCLTSQSSTAPSLHGG
jgi:hypothetical protein